MTRLALTPPGKPGSGAGAGSAAASGEENGKTSSDNQIARAPLRITPNFQPQEKRRPKTDVRRDMAYGAFLTEKSFDIAGEFVQRTHFTSRNSLSYIRTHTRKTLPFGSVV